MTDHDLCNDIIEGFREQVMEQRSEIAEKDHKLRVRDNWIRKIADTTPHSWVREEAKELLDDGKA